MGDANALADRPIHASANPTVGWATSTPPTIGTIHASANPTVGWAKQLHPSITVEMIYRTTSMTHTGAIYRGNCFAPTTSTTTSTPPMPTIPMPTTPMPTIPMNPIDPINLIDPIDPIDRRGEAVAPWIDAPFIDRATSIDRTQRVDAGNCFAPASATTTTIPTIAMIRCDAVRHVALMMRGGGVHPTTPQR